MRSSKLVAFLLPVSALVEGAASAYPPKTSVEQTLTALSGELMKSVEQKDRQALENLVASDFTLQMPGESNVVGRDEWIANAVGKDWSKFRFENLAVRVRGDQALISSRLHFHVAPVPFGLDSGAVDSWERRNGRWQITGRYLGQSDAQQRIALALGVLGAAGMAALVYLIRWLIRKSRQRAH